MTTPAGAGRALGALSGLDGWSFDPAALARAVNALLALGPVGLEVLREHARAGGAERALLAALAVFDPRGDEPPPRLELGRADVDEERGRDAFARWPLHVVDDVPFLLVGGYRLAGQSDAPAAYLDWCARAAATRLRPLVPADDPLAAADAVVEGPGWESLGPAGEHAAMVRMQALRALGDAYGVVRPALDDGRGERWARHRRAVAGARIVWDAARERYVRAGALP